jgi:hypothetical protein
VKIAQCFIAAFNRLAGSDRARGHRFGALLARYVHAFMSKLDDNRELALPLHA